MVLRILELGVWVIGFIGYLELEKELVGGKMMSLVLDRVSLKCLVYNMK